MGIQINGNTNNINAGIGSLSIEDLNELDIVGVATASNFKTGTSNVHSTGYECTNINASGIITATTFSGAFTGDITGAASQITVADESSDTSAFVVFTNTAAGNNAPKTGSNLTFNSATGALNATSFNGDFVGGSVSATSGAFTGNIDLNSDTNKLKIGAGDDFQFYHNGSNNFIETNNGDIRIKTSDGSGNLTFTAGGNTESFRIASDGKVLIDNATGTLTIGGDNVYDSAKINLMVGNSGQTSATTEATALVIHDQNSRRNGTEGSGSWKSKITFRSTQINGNSASEGASIVHDITYNNYSSTKMRSDLVFKTRGDAQTSTSAAATEKLRIRHDGKVDVTGGYIARNPSDSFTLNGVNQPHYGFQLNASSTVPVAFSGYYGIAFASEGAERLRITRNGKIGINNNDPGGRTGSIDTSSNDGTSGRAFTDLRGHSSLILRNPNTTQNSFTQMSFINGGGTQAATLLRHRLGSSHGSLQNYVGDLCLFRRTGGNGGANNDYRESVRWCGSNPHARQIWWAYGDNDTAEQSRIGWHHLSVQRDHEGTDAYSFFRLETGAASYARQGWGKYTCAWSTGHASGYGLATGHFGYYMHHSNSRIYVNEHIIYRERYSNGSYYSWDDAPNLRICNYTQSGGTNAAIVFRCGGRRHSGFDMGVMVALFIDLYVPETANGDTNPRLYSAGNSQSNLDGGGFGSPVNHDYVSFQSSNPNHGAQP